MVQPRTQSWVAWSDRLLDAAVVLFAAWTVAYHACLVLRLGVPWAIGLTVVLVAAWWALAQRLPEPDDAVPPTDTDDQAGSTDPRPRSRIALVTLVAAAVAAVSMAVSAPWWLVWVPWLLAAAAGTWWALARLGPGTATPATSYGEDRRTVIVVLVWALGLALLSLWTLRPNPDDLFYVNLSQWVAVHGSFPIRDTLFSNLAYPMANWPPVASYDGLAGAVAHVLGLSAGTVVYVVVPPIATILSVLALWRMLRAWQVRRVALVISAAMIFLLFDGTEAYGPPGNLFVTRLWQGKVILLCLLVPLMLVHALRYVERPSTRRVVWLGTAGVAAVGLSTTAMFLVPVIAVAAMAPLVSTSWRKALAGFSALAGYAVAAAVVTTLLGGRSADDFGARRLYRFDASFIGHQIFLTGVVALVGVMAVLAGALLVPHRAARLTTALMVVVLGVVLVPGVTRASYDVSGIGPTLWRLSWGCTIGALVGLAVDRGLSMVHGRRTTGVAVVAGLALLVGFGYPVWAADTATSFQAPFHWQRSDGSRALAAEIEAASPPGAPILAPDALAITVAVSTTVVKTVAPRDYYMYYLRDDPTFHYPERLLLENFVNHSGHWRAADVDRALRVVGVGVACVALPDVRRARVLRAAGFVPLTSTSYYRCLHRT